MKQKKRNTSHNLYKSVVWPTAVLSLGLSVPVFAQSQSSAVVEEIIVSARRQEESSQDIPIAITVVDQATMSNNNVFSSVDLKQFTPSLAVNTRFGPDQVSFAIRGFTQELRTTASVGFYFAEVVAPRGGGSVTSGDGAGPGAFFDLQNVLVLKGPQGTLFGRNTTGGAILLTPQEPTNQLEGYLEGSAGDYDMQRVQGVINVPMGDTLRARFGVDTMQRDGYIENKSGVGPGELGDTDYISARASVIWDVTDSLENYTIFSYTDSENNGIASSLFACKSGATFGNPMCGQQLQAQGTDFYAVSQRLPNPASELKQWQVINKTSWEINDDFTIKNILSYADLEQLNRTAVYGINYNYPFGGAGTYGYTESNQIPGGIPTNSQVSFVEELQFQGYAMDGDLTWQAGLYFENSKGDGESGSQSINQLYCSSVDQQNPGNSLCVDIQRALTIAGGGGAFLPPFALGGISRAKGEVEYITQAAYTEMTYDLTDQWKVTGGLRYTKDKSEGKIHDARVWKDFPDFPPIPGPAATVECAYGNPDPAVNGCKDEIDQTSEAVTGLLDFDFFMTQDVMFYGKYSRGYRMGSINLYGGDPYRKYEPEIVDAYELGSKTTFGGPIPGTFNIALFYNELKDQQIQIGFLPLNGNTPTTGIDNAGKSRIEGVEVETALQLLDDLMLTISYTYLETQLRDFERPPGTTPGGTARLIPSSLENEHLTFSPRHSVVANLNYRLPLPAEVGDVSVGATYSYTGSQLSSAPEYVDSTGRLSGSPYALLSSYDLLNLNANWNSIFGSSFDAGVFVTNALDKEYTTYVSGVYNSTGFETRMVGIPKMWGAKLRYNF